MNYLHIDEEELQRIAYNLAGTPFKDQTGATIGIVMFAKVEDKRLTATISLNDGGVIHTNTLRLQEDLDE